jgi:hypothetical protein
MSHRHLRRRLLLRRSCQVQPGATLNVGWEIDLKLVLHHILESPLRMPPGASGLHSPPVQLIRMAQNRPQVAHVLTHNAFSSVLRSHASPRNRRSSHAASRQRRCTISSGRDVCYLGRVAHRVRNGVSARCGEIIVVRARQVFSGVGRGDTTSWRYSAATQT